MATESWNGLDWKGPSRASRWSPAQGQRQPGLLPARPARLGDAAPGLLRAPERCGAGNPARSARNSPASDPGTKLCPRCPRAALLTQEDQGAEAEDAPHPPAPHGSAPATGLGSDPARPGAARRGSALPEDARRAGQAGRREGGGPEPRPGPPARAHTAGPAPLRPRARLMPGAAPGTRLSRAASSAEGLLPGSLKSFYAY